MKDLHYRAYSFRISEEVKNELEKRRKEKNVSWNLFFNELLDDSKRSKK